ncbi:hypothetical protein [Desulfallas thermosapovorans]|uniref:Membrane protein YqhR n=1 Tax=Desulfallas thermosapovorans DSM 6562 TaxID=1121431 RepID=A0A5S4ZQL3_9FIRM|nr:hypothetical protein [Desulfallas thermosapovorans]TYO93901.1 hypothetical protein LX24_02585 [Desulfallas thermosapovorans DSM 6562]
MKIENDRLARGLIAGLAGGVIMNIINLTSYYLNIAELRFLDWASLVIYGTKPYSVLEAIFAQMAQLVFVGLLGIILAYLIPVVTSKNYLLRGWLYGVLIWFSLYGLSYLFKIQATIPLRLDSVLTDLIAASAFGLVTVEILWRLDVDRVNKA